MIDLIKEKWHKKDYQNFIDYLYSFQDQKYCEFHKSLVMENNLIGVRTPKLKEIAKNISKGNYDDFINLNNHKTYEEIIIHGLLIGYIKEPFSNKLEMLNNFLPFVSNWAINDIVCANLKDFKKNKPEGFNYIKKLLKTKTIFNIRFALVLLLNFYINDEYIDEILKIANKIKIDEYYVKMANAWLISICFIKYKDKTLNFLKNNNLDYFTQNKAISKIRDSKRVDIITKKKLLKLRKQN